MPWTFGSMAAYLGGEPRPDAARARLRQSATAHACIEQLPGLRSAAAAGRRAHDRGGLRAAQPTVLVRRLGRDRLEGRRTIRTLSTNDILNIRWRAPPSRASAISPMCRRHLATGRRSAASNYRKGPISRSCATYSLYRRDLPQLSGELASPNSPVRRRQRQCAGDAWRSYSGNSSEHAEIRRRIFLHAEV